MIVVITVTSQNLSPLQSAFDRVLEIAVGSVIGLAVALLVLPARAHSAVAASAARVRSICSPR